MKLTKNYQSTKFQLCTLSGSSLQHNNDVMMTSFGILGFKISISCKPGYKLLKYLAEPISKSLSLIVNESFLNGIYLDKLKPAKVVALHKNNQVIIPQIIDQYHFCLSLVKLLENLFTNVCMTF